MNPLIPIAFAVAGILSLVAIRFKRQARGLPVAQFFHDKCLENQILRDKQRKRDL